MFGMGGSELFLIIFVFLMFFGSNKIPEIAKGLGSGMRQFRDAANGIKDEIEKEAETIKKNTDINKELNS
jgi:sec-independent protein translocase protein TatA